MKCEDEASESFALNQEPKVLLKIEVIYREGLNQKLEAVLKGFAEY